MALGKLYASNSEQYVADVNYQLQVDSPQNWWGELTLTEYKRFGDSGHYIIELEDNRKGKCYLRKKVNRAVSGVPTRYVYHFTGSTPLE